LSGKITNEFGPRVLMTAGMAMMGIGLFVVALIPVNDSLVVIEEIRTGHQLPDRQDARPHRAADAACHRRRGDRVTLGHVGLWHVSVVPTAPSDVGYRS
jgi:hypothetical protein